MFFSKKCLQVSLVLLAALFFLAVAFACSSHEAESSSHVVEETEAFSSSPASPTKAMADLSSSALSGIEAPVASLLEKLKPAQLEVYVAVPSTAYSAKGSREALQEFPAGTTLSVAEDEDEVFWFEASLEDGRTGFLYGETLFPIQEDGTPSAQSLTAQRISSRMSALYEKLPQGKYWNHMGEESDGEDPFSVTDIPCEHSIYGEVYCNFYDGKTLEYFPEYGTLSQCMGFASFLSDQLFGEDSGLSLFYDIDRLQIGDHIRLYEYEHSMIVVKKDENSITVAEVNENYEDCLISWNRVIFFDELEGLSWDSTYATRYPMYRNESGGFSFWEDSSSGFEVEYNDFPEEDFSENYDDFGDWEDWEDGEG